MAAAEESFDLLITTDQQLKYQQNLSGRNLRVLVLMTTSWPHLELHIPEILDALEQIRTGEYRELILK